jgi:Domain of unknown function (DUF4365)
MRSQIRGPRKRRTRQHVIADLSVHHVEGFILEEGHTAERLGSDYGYDLILFTFDTRGYAETGLTYFQLKAMESLHESETDYVYDVDIRDYNLWMMEEMPVILVLFDASRGQAYWIPVQRYFRADMTRRPKKGARTVRVRLPHGQVVNRQAIAKIRELKWEILGAPAGDES